MKRVKAVLPSWREKKRYVVFEVLSNSRIRAIAEVSKAVWRSHLALCGELGAARAGLQVVRFDPASQRGLLRVGHDSLRQVQASLAFVRQVEQQPVLVRTIGVSGILRKAEGYLAS